MLGLVLLCFAFVAACFAAFGYDNLGRFHMGWTAFALFVASQIFGRVL